MQDAAEIQDTPESSTEAVEVVGGLGVDQIDQLLPSHFSASVS
jgi:hypothetical protein